MTVIEKPKKQQFAIVELKWGGSILPNPAGAIDDSKIFLRLTDNTTDVVVEGETYSAVPAMEFKLAENTGLLDEAPTDIIIPEVALDSEMVSGPFSPMFVTVRNVLREGVNEESHYLHVGKLHRTVRNYRGKDGQALLQSVSWKSRLKVRPGLIANHQCQWALFGKGCRTQGWDRDLSGLGPPQQTPTPDIGSAISGCTVDVINGQLVTVSNIFIETGKAKYWYGGFLEHRGLRIKIIDWDEIYFGVGGDETIFTLEERAPASWLSQPMRALPGCDKFVETCRATWDNEANFSGIGHAILTYNPLIESGF